MQSSQQVTGLVCKPAATFELFFVGGERGLQQKEAFLTCFGQIRVDSAVGVASPQYLLYTGCTYMQIVPNRQHAQKNKPCTNRPV